MSNTAYKHHPIERVTQRYGFYGVLETIQFSNKCESLPFKVFLVAAICSNLRPLMSLEEVLFI